MIGDDARRALGRPERILCVCTHNRTRSVLIAALLRHHLQQRTRLGEFEPLVADVGLGVAGMLVTDGVAAALAAYGLLIDPATYASRSLTDRIAEEADLIVVADVTNVIGVSTRSRDLFRRTFTLPEFVARAAAVGARGDADLGTWLRRVGDGRRAGEYLHQEIAQIPDPTGLGQDAIVRCAAEIDLLCRRMAELWE